MRTAAVLFALLCATPALASESRIQECLCKGMQQEVKLPSGARADCLSKTEAIEIDPTNKWAEALGQALHYAEQTDKSPVIYLYCKKGVNPFLCLGHRLRLESTIAAYDLPVALRTFVEDEVYRDCD